MNISQLKLRSEKFDDHDDDNNNNNDPGMTMYQNYYKQVTVLWNQENDWAIVNNKPDIIIRDNKRWKPKLIDGAFSWDWNVSRNETEKTLK